MFRLKKFIVRSKYILYLIKIIFKIINFIRNPLQKHNILKLKYVPYSHIFDNNMYGNEYILKRYSNYTKAINSYIEHGIFWGDHIQIDQPYYYIDNILTFSSIRQNVLSHRIPFKKSIPIGPYLHYAQIQKIDELSQLQAGKTLLFFPNHSVSSLRASHNIDMNIKLLSELKEYYKFDNIIVCLYFLDLIESIVDRYSKSNIHVFTCGHKYNQSFMDRLKSVIDLSDVTLSDSVGTHLGYCIYSNKPHTIINQNHSKFISKHTNKSLLVESIESDPKRISQKAEIIRLFESNNNLDLFTRITNDQYKVCSNYWGFEYIKSKEEIAAIFENAS